MIRYCITDPQYYGSDTSTLHTTLLKLQKQDNFDFICFRDKSSKNFIDLATTFIKTVEGKKTFLNGDYKLAHKLGFCGVHLTSTQFNDIKKAKELNLEVIISTHTKVEISKALAEGADYVTYSPIFATPNKGKPKGLEDLKVTTTTTSMKIIALGGITSEKQIQSVKECGVFGFASIRYFIDI